jgi:endonuclease/exonuclease/phosphatase family metal-dependent hydrolase
VDAGAYGNFFLSRFEVTDFEVHELDMGIDFSDPQKLFRPRNFIHAELAVTGGSTQAVIVPHLEGDGDDDMRQLEQIMGYIATEIPDRPVIICGDTNNAMLYMNIPGASPSPAKEPSLATNPVDDPSIVIDTIRVMNAGDSMAFDYETWDIGSDHLALTALVRVIS